VVHKGIICERAYWGKEAKKLTEYERGSFERIHSENPLVEMHYEGEITPIEMITLPNIIDKLELRHPGCALRLKSIIQGLDNATVEMAVDGSGKVDLEQLKRDWKSMQDSQRKVLGI
jgi:hypothetical protein